MILRYTNSKGDSITFSHQRPYIVSQFTGFADSQVNVQRQKAPYQDGYTWIDSLLEEKPMSLTFTIMGGEQERRFASHVLNPKLRGQIEYNSNNKLYSIDVEIESGPLFPSGDDRGPFHQLGVVEFLALNPFWRSKPEEPMPTFEPLFEFPFEGEFQMGISRIQRVIQYEGDVPTPVQIEFYGPATNPKVENVTTGEYIKVNQTLGENEVMKIDTTSGQKSVVFVDENGDEHNMFHWLDLDSTFFQLQIGENEIEYTADSSVEETDFVINYENRFIGI